MIVQDHATQDVLTAFKMANEHKGQVCYRMLKIGCQEALVGIDTGCSTSSISQNFLDNKFCCAASQVHRQTVLVDNGSAKHLTVSSRVELQLHLSDGTVLHCLRMVIPHLVQPLNVLLLWSF